MNTVLRLTLGLALITSAVALAEDPVQPTEGSVESEEAGRRAFLEELDFKPGPFVAELGDHAEVQIPEGFHFTGKSGTKKFLEATHNIPGGDELGTLLHDKEGYFIIFEFDAVGYVKDDDADALDADAMLKSLREGQDAANKILVERGDPALELTGWHEKPHYDTVSHNLEWAPLVKNTTSGRTSVNYNVRMLGRHGVMEAGLVTDPEQLSTALPQLRTVLAGYKFTSGKDYKSFVQGDKVAEYGLAALVTGGAVAIAAKSGLLAKFGKFILIGVVGVGAWLKRLFTGRSSRNQP